MERRPSLVASLVALAGGALMLASLWLPWYELRLPDAIRDVFGSLGDGAAADAPAGAARGGAEDMFGELFAGLASMIPDKVEVDGWTGMEQGDVVLALVGALVVLAALGVSGILGPTVRIDGGLAGRAIALLGGAGLCVALYHVITRPGGDFPGMEEFIALQHGVWVALLGGLMASGGGLLLLSADTRAADTWTAPAASTSGGQQAGAAVAATPVMAATPVPAPAAATTADGPLWSNPEAADSFSSTPAYQAPSGGSTAPPGFGA